MSIDRVAVVGGGLMGSGIAESVAVNGMSVVLREIAEEPLAATRTRIERSLERAVKRGKLSAGDRDAALARITFTTELRDLTDAELTIEAVPEDLRLKAEVLGAIAEHVAPDALIASNTSSIPIAQLAATVSHPERVLGLHFFSPVPVMTLVEIVVALETTPEAVAATRGFVERLGKHPIETKDRAGFVVNALLVPYLAAAIRMYEDGFASREDIDEGMRRGCGYPMGPLTLADFIGIDVLCDVCDSLYDEFKRSEYAAPPLLKRMKAAGHHGRKSGRGFYDYSQERSGAAN